MTFLPLQGEEKLYPISTFHLEYTEDHPQHPPLETFHIPNPPSPLSSQDILHLIQNLVRDFNERGYAGIYVQVDPKQINDKGKDLRPKSKASLRLLISNTLVKEISTTALGERFKNSQLPPQNRREHLALLKASPIQSNPQENLINKSLLDNYLLYINRYPGRRVDAQLKGRRENDGVNLDLLITEEKPKKFYFHAANTGTKSTRKWIETLGFQHNHLSGRDDILSLEFVTASLKNFHSLRGSYNFPLNYQRRFYTRIDTSWSYFTASQFGLADDSFVGYQQIYSLQGKANLYQDKDLFVDIALKGQWRHISVNNEFAKIKGKENLVIPIFEISIEQKCKTSTLHLNFTAESNLSGIADTDKSELNRMGRSTNDQNWFIYKINSLYTLFLDKALTHEFSLNMNGQYARKSRLIPHLQFVIGGLNSVRGYPQSVAAGDHGAYIQGEYRHYNFFPKENIKTQARIFIDGGRTIANDRLSFENNSTLWSCGMGGNLIFKNHFKLSADWGITLHKLQNNTPHKGSQSFIMSALALY